MFIHEKEDRMKYFVVILLFACLTVLAGCGAQGQTAAAPTPEVDPLSTEPPVVEVSTLPPPPTETPAPTNTPAPVTFDADIAAASLNLRTGPSLLHDILNLYQQGEVVTLVGSAPGHEWVKVILKDGKTGWMYVPHLTLKGDVTSLPVLPISESLVIQGKVMDASGQAVQGIDVGITRTGGAQRVRVNGMTDSSGTFYAYAPVEYQGTWLAAVIGVDCKSPIVDANCRYAGAFTPGEGIQVTLPQNAEILFTYK
jgi:hypothetical protein